MILIQGVGGRRLSRWVLLLVMALMVWDAWSYSARYIREFRFHQESATRLKELERAIAEIKR